MSVGNTDGKIDIDAEGGIVNKNVSLKELREAIPKHCFTPNNWISTYYLFRDIGLAILLMWSAFSYISWIEPTWLNYVIWIFYGFLQGLVWTGLWVLGHESGHGAFSTSELVNDATGFVLHSALLTPYFSWKSTHRRHHMYANNLDKDQNYVPPSKDTYLSSLTIKVHRLGEYAEDSPIITLGRILLQQFCGFPYYLLTNITGAPGSMYKEKSTKFLGNSHFLPSSTLFRPEEGKLILASDFGVGFVVLLLWQWSKIVGLPAVLLLYIQPYVWVNYWISTITYLHHTHPNAPKYENDSWTYLKGVTATVDRDFGWLGKYFFHHVTETHVLHHMFSRIPFYYAYEASNAIIPLLGDEYRSDDRMLLYGVWESFTQCLWVEPDDPDASSKDRVMWYKSGKITATSSSGKDSDTNGEISG